MLFELLPDFPSVSSVSALLCLETVARKQLLVRTLIANLQLLWRGGGNLMLQITMLSVTKEYQLLHNYILAYLKHFTALTNYTLGQLFTSQ